ncbi:oligomeric complex COG6 [Cylindrobasidium torrendii FP15055 ss-10]|uniref:Conserved oligomeric Golgi complex subunit 6 n=1 Tax=Cylindrobasidium torrendii FP15055 ss-10 TaxID=1314674 RepID=A0A0D7AZM1_9AGAR|nr:oligomeric complex COG6 [Cylindrobasidium torrendii FP15055 ss-10]
MASSSNALKGRNPVYLRLYKVLGTNFDDAQTQEALSTLSDLYTTNGDDGAEAAARARKHLRKDLEQKLADGSRQFLVAFGELDEKLGQLQDHVGAMRLSCDAAEQQLAATGQASSSLLEKAGNLRQERQEVETKKSIVELFLARFALKEREIEVITSRQVPVCAEFFLAMDKTERIREDCRVLMAGEDGPTQVGLDIMAATSQYLEQGYDKISRWCAFEFRQLSQLEVSATMRESIQRLRKRPELLTEALATLSQTRQAMTLSAFTAALTRGGPSGFPRPIELHAHDPIRYIGDQLAWVHQAIAAEREFLDSLFNKTDRRMVGSVRDFSEKSEEEDWIQELMDLAVGKLCVPLKTVRSQESSIMSYKISNLLHFYQLTMRRTIGPTALLTKTLDEITEAASKVFFDTIDVQSRALLRTTLDTTDLSLDAPMQIRDHALILKEIISVFESSVLGEDAESELVTGFEHVLDIMIDPAIQMCIEAGEVKARSTRDWDLPIFVLNCLFFLLKVLEPFPFTGKKKEAMDAIIDERVAALTEEHYHNIMADAGLEELMTTCERWNRSEPLSYVPSARPPELRAALHQFAQWLSSVEVVHSARLNQLTSPRPIHHAALERMAQAYKTISEEVRKPENKYEAASTLLGSERPFGQVHLLWQIFGLEEND